ncbi:hypothetical protein ABIB83_003341 [Bradyrhizobium sp. I1.8.5]|uniref:hypothetical protein n=1 Tax=unclassified Bradyrhizobium TaxID=2631580 RepID=UPI00339A32D9
MRALMLACLLAFSLVSHAKANEPPPDWLAARLWLDSADCALKTGKFLVLCRDSRVIPIGDDSLGDDPGHALALGLYSALTGRAAKPSDIARINLGINVIGLILLALLLLTLQLRISAALVLLSIALARQYPILTPHPAGLGDACLSAILPLALLGLPLIKASQGTFIGWLVAGILSLATASLFRQSTAMMGVAASAAAIAVSVAVSGRRTILPHIALLLAVFVAYKAPHLVHRARDIAYNLQPARFTEEHGPWHSLYIGLGVNKNPFGIRWDDASGIEAVERLDSRILFGTPAYFDALKHEYFRIVTTSPRQVLQVYATKLASTLHQSLPAPLHVPIMWPLLLVGLAAMVVRFWIARHLPPNAADAALFVASLYTCFFIGQAVLINYAMIYMFPIGMFLLLAIGACLDLTRRTIST